MKVGIIFFIISAFTPLLPLNKTETMDRINLMYIAYYLGQLTDQDLTPGDVRLIIELVDKFSKWEEKNVMSLKNGWEDYMSAGGNSYEDEIIKWVKEFIENNWKLWNM